jgi:hypothetical protein
MNECSPSVKRLLAKLGHARNVKLLLAPKTTQDRATNVVELIGSSKAISQGNAMQLPRQLLKQRDYALNTNIRAKIEGQGVQRRKCGATAARFELEKNELFKISP